MNAAIPHRAASAAARTSAVINPSRVAEIAGRVRISTAREVDAAVEAAAVTQREWTALDVEDRATRLERIAARIEARASELA